MRIVTNPGSNLSSRVIAFYRVCLTPQQIAVDGSHHDTREPISFATIDQWTRTAKTFPHTLGTSAAQSTEFFRSMLASEAELLVVTSGKKLVLTHTASVAAARSIASGAPGKRVHVFDSQVTDMGAGFNVILAGEAQRAGLPSDEIVALLESFAPRQHSAVVLDTLDNIVKGGKASYLKAWLADLMSIAPVLGFRDGEVRPVARVSRNVDRVHATADVLCDGVDPARPCWAAVVHGGDPKRAEALAALLRARLKLVYLVVRPLAASTYVNLGSNALGGFIYPVDRLPWTPTEPPVS